MKQLLLATAIASLLFVGCDKDNDPNDEQNPETEEVKKLLSRTVFKEVGATRSWEIQFVYDSLNRLIRTIHISKYDLEIYTHTIEFMYNADDSPAKVKFSWEQEITFLYNNNQILVINAQTTDTLTKNADGQLVELRSCDDYRVLWIYDVNGNLTDVTFPNSESNSYNYTYTDVKSVMRHINASAWFYSLFVAEYTEALFITAPTSRGNMVSRFSNGSEIYDMTYELDADGYVKRAHMVITGDTHSDSPLNRFINSPTSVRISKNESQSYEFVFEYILAY